MGSVENENVIRLVREYTAANRCYCKKLDFLEVCWPCIFRYNLSLLDAAKVVVK